MNTPVFYAWRGTAFEMACLLHLQQIKHAIGISAVSTECFPLISSTADPGAQINLVIERGGGVTNVCKMKCTDEPFAIDRAYEEALKRKVTAFQEESGTGNALLLTTVSAAGLVQNAHSWDIAVTVGLDDLFAF